MYVLLLGTNQTGFELLDELWAVGANLFATQLSSRTEPAVSLGGMKMTPGASSRASSTSICKGQHFVKELTFRSRNSS
jgi:hypothetical protein